MTAMPGQRPSFAPAARTPVRVDMEGLVALEPIAPSGAPAILRPKFPGLDLAEWAGTDRGTLRTILLRCGAVLLRGFNPLSPERLERFFTEVFTAPREYDNRSTPRTRVSGRIFTSTEYPADQTIPQHNEMSYADAWPRYLCFDCLVPARSGGETPLADGARVFARIPADLRERFERLGVLYVRNFGQGLDLTWQDAFQQDTREAVDRYCHEHGIGTEWLPGGRLRTRQANPATILHPETGQKVWFNQAHLFHPSALPADVVAELTQQFAFEDLPRNALWGDGSPMSEADIEPVRQAYRDEEIVFAWEAGDVLLIDNIRMSHGRRPYEGPRNVVVAMA